MADLSVQVGSGRFPPSVIQPPPVGALSRLLAGEVLHISPGPPSAALIAGLLSRALADETLHIGLGVPTAVLLAGVLTRAVADESLHLTQAFSALRESPGDVMFTASPGHASVTDYEARLRVSGNATVVDTLSLGVPTPDVFGNIVASLTALYSGQAAGDYTVSIAATSAGGTDDSEESNAFTLPLA